MVLDKDNEDIPQNIKNDRLASIIYNNLSTFFENLPGSFLRGDVIVDAIN